MDEHAKYRARRYRARKRGEEVPFRKPGRPRKPLGPEPDPNQPELPLEEASIRGDTVTRGEGNRDGGRVHRHRKTRGVSGLVRCADCGILL